MDNVNHPKHYESGFGPVAVECIDVTRHLPFSVGNAIKYIWRAGKKESTKKAIEDLEKARWYINDWATNSTDPANVPGRDKAAVAFSFCARPAPPSDKNYAPLESMRYAALHAILTGPCPDWNTASNNCVLGMIRVLNSGLLKADK